MADDADAKSRIALGEFGGVLAIAGTGTASPGANHALLAGINRQFMDAPPDDP